MHRWTAPDGWQLRCASPGPPRPRRRAVRSCSRAGGATSSRSISRPSTIGTTRGWTITSFDWRGQGGSGRLTAAANCGDIDSFDSFIADLRAFYLDWEAATPGPHVVMGHSMGGHLVLRGLVEGAIRPDAAVIVAPMLGVKSALGPFAERAARILGDWGTAPGRLEEQREALYHRNPRQPAHP